MSEGINCLIKNLSQVKKVYIQPHNMPDPDAIASSYALSELLKMHNINTKIVYVNYIEKANSKKMIEMFSIGMTLREGRSTNDLKEYVVFIDTQIGNSNITSIEAKNIAVIDHHKNIGDNDQYFFCDIQEEVGACATIISSYYRELGIVPDVNIATALLYGIMNDTNNLTRTNSNKDLENFYWLYSIADLSKIKNLRMNEIGRDDLYAYAKALEDIEIYKNIGFVHIENCNDSLLGTISDMVYTIEGVSVVVSYAKRRDGIKFSIRSGENDISADELVKFIITDKGVGGGHNEMAGGFIKGENLDFFDDKELHTYVRYRSIAFMEKSRIIASLPMNDLKKHF